MTELLHQQVNKDSMAAAILHRVEHVCTALLHAHLDCSFAKQDVVLPV